MSNEIINPYQTFYDDDGIPLANGTISFLVNTTTTLGTIYSDEALAVAQANPYPLDAYGRIKGDVKYTGLRTLLIKTDLGATVRTMDNVTTVANTSDVESKVLGLVVDYPTLAAAVADTDVLRIYDGSSLNIKERTTGNGGGAMWDVVLSSTVTENTYDIVQCTGIGTLSLVLRESTSVDTRQLGDTGDGTTNDTLAMQFAIDNYETTEIYGGTHLIDGLVVNDDDREVIFIGDVYLKANANDVVLFLQTMSFSRHKGTFRTATDGKTGVIGMMCAPEDRTQTTTLTQTNHNQMPGIIGNPSLELCIGLQCGPDVGGTDSGCFYNVFPFGRGRGAVGGIRMFPGPNASSSSNNRNAFYDFRMGTGGGVSANFGLYIESGDTNKFFGCDFEGVGSGTARTSPLPIPTAVTIINQDVNGIDNNFNTFFGGQYEANTADLDIANPRTYLYGVGYSDSKSTLPTSSVFKTIPARDSGVAAMQLLGLRTIDDDNIIVKASDFGDDNGVGGYYRWREFALGTTEITQGGADITAIAQTESYYRQLFGMITWHFRFAFTAVSTTENLVIALPLAAQNDLYVASGSAQTMQYPCTITNGTTEISGIAKISGTDLVIEAHSGNWNTGSNVNAVWVQIDYHAV